ncbi:SPOR domain-containing protein [Borrelia miyamotoi]|uniref:SPOR domain-containing protein n=1 Tax=Borrelia miyamotoi TaxID=47466 RepID=A0AAX3JLL7_9SPIR|nr:SPOR domain-containing protein [Borrelia miyamotoi]QFP41807.1 SPOR domain-containing protein [Borrelia miyamotoi]QFP47927.1 SPOR domain-containing protein [Borrelia miyamotoi]QGT55686.1 SPOR domain-containing protein [Borrelia miyamotoi]QGT56468.1 SPOR domain-containing protein [Borrelia miyamotoi]WAZ71716.1 SPOR domain-containing protein [Borrelia miyamotoi]
MQDFNENNSKGFLVALTSIVAVCTIIFLGIIIFFPNKNLASNIASKNIILQEVKDEKVIENENPEETLSITDKPNEIIIDLTQDSKQDKSLSNSINNNNKKIINKQKPQIINQQETKKTYTKEKIPQTTKIITKINKEIKKEQNYNKFENKDNKYDSQKEYYIQFASLSDPISADNNIQELMKYKINARIHSATVNDKDIYRIRSGPYKTISEAKLELKKILGLNEFKDAYILTINK